MLTYLCYNNNSNNYNSYYLPHSSGLVAVDEFVYNFLSVFNQSTHYKLKCIHSIHVVKTVSSNYQNLTGTVTIIKIQKSFQDLNTLNEKNRILENN